MPKNKYIESPDAMWLLFEAYVKEVKSKPFKVKDWVGKDGFQIEREKEKPLTVEGFEMYCFKEGIINDLGHYFSNLDDRYKEYVPICSRIRKSVRIDQIEGGMAGMYNPSITQRLNGLVEKSENKTDVTGIIKADFGTTIHTPSEPKTDT